MTITRAEGVTTTERYLQKLCDKTFLSLWSYPGAYRDQDNAQGGDGKEICDLLVVFGNHILIFSDKDCQFPSSGDINLDWDRWFKRAVFKSAEQAWGAERWIKRYPNRIFIDRACKVPFPVNLPKANDAILHLIVVAHDSRQRCRQEVGGSGSLIVNSKITGQDHYSRISGSTFTIGDLDPKRTFVHVLGDESLDILLATLDTISDFVGYLEKKIKLIRSIHHVIALGEEDLLGYYLSNVNQDEVHDFAVLHHTDGEPSAVVFDDGHWDEFSSSDHRKSQVQADSISYIWDHLIEDLSKHVIQGTHYYRTGSHVSEAEELLRWLAREPRLRRRVLMKALGGLIRSAPHNQRATRYIVPLEATDPYYVFLTLPLSAGKDHDDYRAVRRELMGVLD